MYITNEDDIFTYFSVINDICPASVIDVGMFLKRIGAISRQARGAEISDGIKLDGVDLFPDINPEVFNVIYDDIYGLNNFEKNILYDLMIMLRVDKVLSCDDIDRIWEWAKQNVKYVLTNCETEAELEGLKKMGRVRNLSLENNLYAIVIF